MKRIPRTTFWFLVVFSSTAVAVGLATEAPDGSPGPYPVAAPGSVTLHDASRDKDVQVTAFYPASAGGKFPVIVFSHGAGSSGRYYAPLMNYWASHGYVCLLPDHADARALLTGVGHPGGMLGSLISILRDPSMPVNRVADMKLVIDSLPEVEAKIPGLQGKLDRARLGVGGHSLGAFTSQLMDGATTRRAPATLADSRPQAFLLMSPQGRNELGFDAHSWDHLKRPTMVMTGSKDRGITGQGAEAKLEPYTFAPPGDKYGVNIEGASHFSFSGRAALMPEFERNRPTLLSGRREINAEQEKRIFEEVEATSLLFWDAYLKGSAKAKSVLQSSAIPQQSEGMVHVEWK